MVEADNIWSIGKAGEQRKIVGFQGMNFQIRRHLMTGYGLDYFIIIRIFILFLVDGGECNGRATWTYHSRTHYLIS